MRSTHWSKPARSFEEALRLYPPIIGITRTALRRTELAGRIIDRGTMVVISPYVVHRHRLLWNDPEIFDPIAFSSWTIEDDRAIHLSSFRGGAAQCA